MVMTGYQFDLITIGAGSGGVAASRRAGSYGARVALCEFDRVGGTCVLRGCVPKKLLVYASHVAEELRDAAGFGWTIGKSSHDWPALIAAKDRELDRLNQAYLRMLGDAGVAVHYGRARLRDAHTVVVQGEGGEKELTAANILIATGNYPVRPEIPGSEYAVTSNEILSLPALPRRVVIIGTGYIGVEFACMFHALGVEVTLIGRGQAVVTYDADAVRVGCSICYDLRFGELYRRLAADGAQLIMVPAAFTRETGKDPRGHIVVDYFMCPAGELPTGWPEVVPNVVGLQRFVFHHCRDYLRRVSKHVSIGKAYKDEATVMGYFVLARQGT